MRVLVTGANGMLGRDLCSHPMAAGVEVIRTDIAGDAIRMDITDLDNVRAVMRETEPEVVIHCAAYTQVDQAETDRDTAFRINALGTEVVAQETARRGAAMCCLSTDFVFDGSANRPYHEYDATNPLSVYAASKLAGEQAAARHCPRHWIVRTAWLYGIHGRCFPATILRAARAGKPVRVVADRCGSPTFTRDLAGALWSLVAQPSYGTYHVVNAGQATWYDLACAVLQEAGMLDTDIVPIPASDWPSPARRPRFSVLTSLRPELPCGTPMRHWRAALADYVAALKSAEKTDVVE